MNIKLHPPLTDRSFERILLIKPSSLGDIIHALPVLDGLRARYPDARIDWLIGTPFVPLLEGHSQINELIPFDRTRFGRMAGSPRSSAAFLRFVLDLRSRRYDVAVDLQGLFRSGFLAWCTRALVRIGFEDAREGARVFYTHRLRPPSVDMHAVDKNALVAEALGVEGRPVRFGIELSDGDRKPLRNWLPQGADRADRPLVLIAPGARWDTKRWPADNFVAIIDQLHDKFDATCVLAGGGGEKDLCTSIATRCGRAPLSLAGQTTLKQLSALVERASLVLCHDSAVAHLAVAFQRPLVCLTGPTNPVRTGPYGRLGDVLRLDLPCSPCYLRRLSQCPHDHRCLRELSVASVWEAMSMRMGTRRAVNAMEP